MKLLLLWTCGDGDLCLGFPEPSLFRGSVSTCVCGKSLLPTSLRMSMNLRPWPTCSSRLLQSTNSFQERPNPGVGKSTESGSIISPSRPDAWPMKKPVPLATKLPLRVTQHKTWLGLSKFGSVERYGDRPSELGLGRSNEWDSSIPSHNRIKIEIRMFGGICDREKASKELMRSFN